jgi:hypothetical protein
MNNIVHILSGIILVSALAGTTIAQTLPSDSVTMSAGYANEIYYSMPNGTILTSPRNTWDIAFRTSKMSSGILTNDGAGVILWSYPKADSSAWASIDTSGLSTWTPMYNDPKDWENGAFSRYALGHPDYGWGVYNSVTHDVEGDSIFIIKLRNGSYKKFRVIAKHSVQNIFSFRWADLDGGNEHTVDLDLNPFMATDYFGFDLTTATGIDFQADLDQWDLLFTKYMSVQPDGTPYAVTGVLSNPDIKVKRFEAVPTTYTDWWVGDWDSTRSPIGWDWKAFNMGTFTYDMVDSLVFFVLSQNNDIYKLLFTKFDGTSTGKIAFDLGKVSSLGIGGKVNTMSVTAYPNPASDRLALYFTSTTNGTADIRLTNIAGNVVRTAKPAVRAGELNETVLDVTGLNPGIYLAVIVNGNERAVQKIVVNR